MRAMVGNRACGMLLRKGMIPHGLEALGRIDSEMEMNELPYPFLPGSEGMVDVYDDTGVPIDTSCLMRLRGT
jgi:hypothetical protein